jgi:hypothetical protein
MRTVFTMTSPLTRSPSRGVLTLLDLSRKNQSGNDRKVAGDVPTNSLSGMEEVRRILWARRRDGVKE